MDKRTFYAQASGGADLHGQHQIVAEESPNTVALVYDQVDSNGRATAQEIARRWNAHVDLVKHLDGLLVQLEDTGDALDATIIEARQMLEAHGYDDKALGKLIDENP